VLLRILLLLVLSVFINPDSEACEFTGDLEASVISIRHNRLFSDAAKITNFSFNKGSDCYYYYYSSISACSPRAGTDNIHICASL
jgi:hypothetical protein